MHDASRIADMARELLAYEMDQRGYSKEAALVRSSQSTGEAMALRAITAAYNKGRADMREEAANVLRGKAIELRAKGGVTAKTMASVFADQAAAIRAIPVEGE